MLHDYLKEEQKRLQEILAEFPGLDRDRILKPFYEYPYLPEGTETILLMAEASGNRECVPNLASVAFDTFLLNYLERAAAYFVEELGVEVTLEDLQSPEKAQQLQDAFKELHDVDELAAWLTGEGMQLVSRIRTLLKVDDIPKLATFVRRLNYYGSLFPEKGDPEVGYGYLHSVLTQLHSDLVRLGLMSDSNEVVADCNASQHARATAEAEAVRDNQQRGQETGEFWFPRTSWGYDDQRATGTWPTILASGVLSDTMAALRRGALQVHLMSDMLDRTLEYNYPCTLYEDTGRAATYTVHMQHLLEYLRVQVSGGCEDGEYPTEGPSSSSAAA